MILNEKMKKKTKFLMFISFRSIIGCLPYLVSLTVNIATESYLLSAEYKIKTL